MRYLLAVALIFLSVGLWADGTVTPTTTSTATPSPTPVIGYVNGQPAQYQQYTKTLTLYYGEPARFSIADFEGMNTAAQISMQVENLGVAIDVKLNSYAPKHLGKFGVTNFNDMGISDVVTWTWYTGDSVLVTVTWWGP